MAAQLWERGADRPASEPVWASQGGTYLRDENVRKRVLKPAARKVGLDWVGFHSFRHTAASLLFEAGRDVKQVQEWLGHHDPGFTLRTYVHLLDQAWARPTSSTARCHLRCHPHPPAARSSARSRRNPAPGAGRGSSSGWTRTSDLSIMSGSRDAKRD